MLTENEQDTLSKVISIETFNKGEAVIVEDQEGGNLYLLKSGCVDVILTFNGKTIKLKGLGEGAQLGDMSFVDGGKTSASIIAKDDCVAYKLTRDALSQLFVSHQAVVKEVMFTVMQNMSQNLRQMNQSNAVSIQYIQGRKV